MTNTNNPQWLDDAIIDINKKGPVRRTDESGNPSVEYMEVVKEGESVSARVKALMDKGISENEAKETAIKEATDRMDGKLEFPDVESYIRWVLEFDKTDKEHSGELTFSMSELMESVQYSSKTDLERFLGIFTTPGDAIIFSTESTPSITGIMYLSKDFTFKFIPFPGSANLIFGKEVSIDYERKEYQSDHDMCLNLPAGFNYRWSDGLQGVNGFSKAVNNLRRNREHRKNQERIEKTVESFDF